MSESAAVPALRPPRAPRYRWSQPVQAMADLHNDGSHPDAAPDALLVAQGAIGEVVRIGHHAEADMPIYLVDFGTRVVGCAEDELGPVAAQHAEIAGSR